MKNRLLNYFSLAVFVWGLWPGLGLIFTVTLTAFFFPENMAPPFGVIMIFVAVGMILVYELGVLKWLFELVDGLVSKGKILIRIVCGIVGLAMPLSLIVMFPDWKQYILNYYIGALLVSFVFFGIQMTYAIFRLKSLVMDVFGVTLEDDGDR